MIAELAVSVVLAVVTHDPRLVLARAACYVAIGGLACLASTVFGRPLTYTGATPMATMGDPERTRAYAAAWDGSAPFRRIHVQLSAVIGAAMLVYAVLRIVDSYALTPAG